MSKNLVFMNLFPSNLPVRPPPYTIKNLLSLKFETGSNFLKPMKKILYTWPNKISQH